MSNNQYTSQFAFKTPKDKRNLRVLAKSGTIPHRYALRARILLLRAKGKSQMWIADVFEISRKSVWNIEQRYKERGIEAIYDLPGRGRKPSFSP